MNQLTTQGIILSRTDFGEADKIITLLTPDHGKLRLMARGVRRAKSRLAGGVELFSVSDIVYIKGRGEIGTLISARLTAHYGRIVKDVNRTMLGYELIKQCHKVTEDEPEAEYFTLLEQSFQSLDDATVPLELIRFWYNAQLLRQAGYTPNLYTDSTDQTLTADQSYDFSYDDMLFVVNDRGRYQADHIKFLRLAFNGNVPKLLHQVQGGAVLLPDLLPITQTLLFNHL
ncbi:MAG: DNA repair protein RecO [Patescibacteria group bacterium]|nr:DNA repair protein RecO [Patescibacteria group bacterium]